MLVIISRARATADCAIDLFDLRFELFLTLPVVSTGHDQLLPVFRKSRSSR